MMTRTMWLLFLLLFAAAPVAAYAAPGDGAPPDMGDDDDDDDDDDEPGGSAPPPIDEEEEDEPEPEPEPEDEPEAEEDEDEPEAEEDEEELDDRYALPPLDDSAEEEEEEEPARARPSDDEYEDEDEEEEDEAAQVPAQKRRGLVKVIQRKFFLKYRRVEITPMIGGMLTDDFINRLAVGAILNVHVNDILAIEFLGNYLPDLESTDYKPLTNRLKNRDEVVPEVSRIIGTFTANMSLSPIYGKIELGTLSIINYDIYVSAGIGFVSTVDDTFLVQETSPCHGFSRDELNRTASPSQTPACDYIFEEHFVTSIGAGFRVVFNDFIGIRLDGRGFAHVETLFRDDNGNPEVGLDMKQNFQLSFGVSFFVPPTARTVQ